MNTLSPATDRATSAALNEPDSARTGLATAMLGAIGIVYGDIGTSPLYTVKEVFAPATGVALSAGNLIGAVSCMFWALMLVVTLKYVTLILRADNRGEGGGLALTALAAQAVAGQPHLRHALLLVGVFGATLFYGDSVITPAISVLGAMEGLQVAVPALGAYVVPATLVILVALFALQRFGTATVGRLFGPVIVLWFVVLALTGVWHIAQQPAILTALDPRQAAAFLAARGWQAWLAIGAIVLTITGAEALYADLGHFGRRPIQLAWTTLVLPSLALNYMGQGALLMGDPSAIENPFYRLFPQAWLIPALLLATLAAIIASQAVISGAYSLTRQAIQLGFLPRMSVRHTSARATGQIYMPAVNWLLLTGVVAAVVGFGSSSALAGAYGIAVTMTMLITTLLTYFVVARLWQLPKAFAIGATAFFMLIDAVLVIGCAFKFFDGGWFPLALSALLFAVMSTWHAGRARTLARIQQDGTPLQPFVDALDGHAIARVPRTAAYLVAEPDTVPQALLHNLKHNQVLHERNLIVTVVFHEVPWVGMTQRANVEALGHGFWRVTLNFGFMNTPDVPRALRLCEQHGVAVPPFETSYFLSRQTIIARPQGPMAGWRARLFVAMSRNASSVAEYFALPDNAVVELGTRVQV
jgi:KUP system potassium uptake protein